MHTPIPTFTGRLLNVEQPMVDARDLYTYLQVSSRFNDWIANRIKQYGFTEGEDFCYSNFSSRENQTLSGRFGNLLAGNNRRDYHLSLEMAKELALVENNTQGRIIRRELIAFERRVREQVPRLEATLAALRQQMLASHPLWGDIARYKRMELSHTEIARLLQRNPSTIRRHVREMESCGLITPPPTLARMQQMALPLLSRLEQGGES